MTHQETALARCVTSHAMDQIAVEAGAKTRAKRVCSNCGSDKTRMNRNKLKNGGVGRPYPNWTRDGKGGWLCKSCYMHPLILAYYRANREKCLAVASTCIRYKGRRIYTNREIRIGVCNFCRAVRGEINAQTGKLCGRTDRAHMSYHDDDPLKDTLEACQSCHTKYDNIQRTRLFSKERASII